MPSKNPRIGLTLEPELYAEVDAWRKENGVSTMTTACTMLIRQALTSNQQSKKLMELVRGIPMEKLLQISAEGFQYMKENSPEKEQKSDSE